MCAYLDPSIQFIYTFFPYNSIVTIRNVPILDPFFTAYVQVSVQKYCYILMCAYLGSLYLIHMYSFKYNDSFTFRHVPILDPSIYFIILCKKFLYNSIVKF